MRLHSYDFGKYMCWLKIYVLVVIGILIVTGELLRTYEEQLLHGMMFDYYCD